MEPINLPDGSQIFPPNEYSMDEKIDDFAILWTFYLGLKIESTLFPTEPPANVPYFEMMVRRYRNKWGWS